jgi:hypothetical protein
MTNIDRHGYQPHGPRDQHRFATEDNYGEFASKYAKLDTLPEGVSIYVREEDGAVIVREPPPILPAHGKNGPDYQETRVDSAHDVKRQKLHPEWRPWYAKFLTKTKKVKADATE